VNPGKAALLGVPYFPPDFARGPTGPGAAPIIRVTCRKRRRGQFGFMHGLSITM
jgi:hypothetical protein